MSRCHRFAAIVLSGLVATLAAAQKPLTEHTLAVDESAPPPPSVAVEELAWLAGTWRGSGLGGECEEVWAAPSGGTMVGTFKLLRDGKPVFYELLLLVRDEAGTAMLVKHFNPDFSAWEGKEEHVRFRLLRHAHHEALFSGLTLRRNGDELEVFLSLQQDGVRREERFAFRRLD